MLAFWRIERNAALLLLVSAALGLWAANSPLSQLIGDISATKFAIYGQPADLKVVFSQFLMTGFFLLIGLELKRELTTGTFSNRRALLVPTSAALFGALVPALAFCAIVPNHTDAAAGWPIPMATDVTFALAIFSVFARSMPASARTFLLSFAVIDDIIAIIVIAVFLGGKFDAANLLIAVTMLLGFALAARAKNNRLTAGLCIAFALAAWHYTQLSGVEPIVVGVILGLVYPAARTEALDKRIHPWVSLFILPIFAFFACQVPLTGGMLLGSALTIAILLRPVGKILGISFGAWLARVLVREPGFEDLKSSDFLRMSTLGGIGFTVALLVSNAVFGPGSQLANEAIIATLVAMVGSMLLGALALSARKP